MPKREDGGNGRTEFRESGESRVDSVSLELGLGDPKEEEQQDERLLYDPGKFSSCSSGTNLVQATRELGMTVKDFTMETKLNKAMYFF